MKKYKVVHLIWHEDTNLKFYSCLIEMINSHFSKKDHLFVTPYKNAYDDLHRKYDNIEFFSPRAKSSGSIVRHCLHQGRWVILHGGCPPVLFLKPGDYKRIIWRTWGGDVRYTYREGEILRNTGKKILNLCKRLLIRRLYAVGIANTVDKININQAFGHVKTLRIAYPSKEIDNWSEIAYIPSNDDNCINILVGHSGYPANRHITILESLEKYKNENIQIHIILSYGDKEYIESVENYVQINWPSKVTIHKDFMEYRDYIKFLSTMHIAIFDATLSYALGNIALLIAMKKILVVNRNGVIKKAFDEDDVPYICSDSLGIISYDELIRKRDYSRMKDGMKILTYTEEVKNWENCIIELDNVTHRKSAGGGYNNPLYS